MEFKFLIRQFISWAHKNRKFIPSGYHPVKINLGSGRIIASGWINVDNGFTVLMATFPHWFLSVLGRLLHILLRSKDINEWIELIIQLKCERCYFIHYDLNYGLPFPDEFADFIYSSHFLEHFTQKGGVAFLKECNRVLKSGGIIRICVPDLEKYVQLYLGGERIRFLSTFFSELRGVDEHYGQHRFMYDYNLLHNTMEKVGFKKITRCEYRKGKTPDLNILDVQGETTLYIEAIKQ